MKMQAKGAGQPVYNIASILGDVAHDGVAINATLQAIFRSAALNVYSATLPNLKHAHGRYVLLCTLPTAAPLVTFAMTAVA